MITVLNIEKFLKENGSKGPIESPQVFFGKTNNFHPEGLYSEDFFGIQGSIDRKQKYSWINLNCNLIHPLFYDIMIKQIERKIPLLISGEKKFKINEKGNLIEDVEGDIDGLSKLYQVIQNVKFRRDENPDTFRNKIINVLENNISKNMFFINKLIVVPPDFRQIVTMEEFNKTLVDDLSILYQKLIIQSKTLSGVSGTLYDVMSYRMQLLVNDVYNYVREKIATKSGLLREHMLGRRVDFSARSVITPNPNLDAGQAGIPFRIICQIFEPFIIYGLTNSPYAKQIPTEFYDAVKEFLKKEETMGISL